jgi:hypothetical protein
MAEAQSAVCWKPGVAGRCRVILLTNVGGYGMLGRELEPMADPSGGVTGFERKARLGVRAVADWGLLAKVGERDAIGASVAASLESVAIGDEFSLAGYVRYRRWLGLRQSLDLAVGVPFISDTDTRIAPYGLIKWNPNDWIGLALRPELRRGIDYSTAQARNITELFLSAGVEVGYLPGFVGSILGAAISVVAVAVALANSD